MEKMTTKRTNNKKRTDYVGLGIVFGAAIGMGLAGAPGAGIGVCLGIIFGAALNSSKKANQDHETESK